MLRKGQVVTGYYRWLQRRGGYLWIQSTATVSINHKAPHERNVIWVNYVLRSVQSQQSPTLNSDMRRVNAGRHHAECKDPLKRQMMKSGGILEEFLSVRHVRRLMNVLLANSREMNCSFTI